MPVAGEGRLRFDRSYIWVIPNNQGPGTWRLTNEDITSGGGGDISELISTATVASDSPPIIQNQLIYIDDSGFARLADASDPTKSKVAGFAVANAIANGVVSYHRNIPISITNVNIIVDNDSTGQLESGKLYYLSAVNPGNMTRTPDTTTPGSVVIQVGLALDNSNFSIEIQTPTVI